MTVEIDFKRVHCFELMLDGKPVLFRQHGKPWNEMVEVRDASGRALILSTPSESGLADVFRRLFDATRDEDGAELVRARIIKGHPEVIATIGSDRAKSEQAR